MTEAVSALPARADGTAPGLGRRYLEWWVYDLPPMHGLLRFVFYGGLFLLALDYPTSPLRGIELYTATSPELFRSYGLFALLGVPYLAPETLRLVIVLTSVAWICAAIGLFSRVAAVATALGALFLHGMFIGSTVFNHNYFLSVYALLALCFARSRDRWSVDYHLHRWRTGRRPEPEASVADTGLARKVVLVIAVGFYFSAGMTKLYQSGFAWADGHTIAYFAQERGGPRLLARLLAENLWLCTMLAGTTLALELGAPAALFSRRARYLLLAGWTGMHVGIRYAMGPRYWENILCFALLIDWGAAFQVARERLRLTAAGAAAARKRLRIDERRLRPAVAAASLLFPLVLGVALLQVFWWPLTNVYMYCSYFSRPHQVRAGYPEAAFHDAEQAQAIARTYLAARPPIEVTEHFAFLADLGLAGDDREPFPLREVPGIGWHKQWTLTVLRPVLIEDLAAKPQGRIQLDPETPDYPAQRLLLEYLPVLRRHGDPALLARYDRLELRYPLADGPAVIAAVRLDVGGAPASAVPGEAGTDASAIGWEAASE